MTIGERLKIVRDSLSEEKTVSMAKFAEPLQVSPATINQWEKDKREIPKPLIKMICGIYGINEKWLKYGEGEMLVPKTRNEEIAGAINEILADKPESFRKRFIEAVVRLDKEDWDAAEKIFSKLNDLM